MNNYLNHLNLEKDLMSILNEYPFLKNILFTKKLPVGSNINLITFNFFKFSITI